MRLIDADALIPSYAVAYSMTNNRWHMYVNIETINSAPTIDAVEVVRCRECRYLKHDADYQWCGMIGVGCEKVDDDYCSYGERNERTL